MTIQETIAVVGVLAAFLTALVSLIGLRWNKQSLEAKDSQIATLKQQVETHKDRSPAEIQKQLQASQDMLGQQIAALEASLTESNRLLVQKSEEVSQSKLATAVMMGYGKVFFGIDDGELMVRSLHGLLYSRIGMPIDYGEQQVNIWSFYVNAVRIFLRNEDAMLQFAQRNAEWSLDYLLIPLLACMRFKSLRNPVVEISTAYCNAMEQTPFRLEVPIYREALEQAKLGQTAEFEQGQLPKELQMKMLQLPRAK